MKKDIQEYLDSKEFYELMRDYRTAPIGQHVYVTKAYEDVKKFIIKMVDEMNKPEPKPDVVLYAYSEKCKNDNFATLTSGWDFNFFNKHMNSKPNIKLTYDG